MPILVDADACPRAIKTIIFRAADRTQTPTLLVANQMIHTPPSPYIHAIQVPSGFDMADNAIVQRVQLDDLVITADIPLAAQIVAKGATGLNPRGEFYTPETVATALSLRNFMQTLRETGALTDGPSPQKARDLHLFAQALDRWLVKKTS
ncbi:MAG: YaiI/YqxD family protein [Neisseriaceae bacterium]|nr:YaiI/YqxD family protein [Neisseriaceae bacterium]